MASQLKLRRSGPSVYVLRITLRDTKPPIWRRLAVLSDTTLGKLHEIIQVAMGWTDSHLHHFILRNKANKPTHEEIRKAMATDRWGDLGARMRGERVFAPTTTPFGDPMDMDGEDEDSITLGEVCPNVKSKLIYEYDFGDGWEHTIELQKIEEPEEGVAYPVCLAGKLACPPEDCGGVYGYYHLLEVIADPKHEEHDDLVEWLGDNFDPNACDIEEINAQLAEFP